MKMVSTREKGAISKKLLAQRDALWPGAAGWIWDRSQNKGFSTIPKTMPIILKIMDDLSNGKPLSSTYLGLWCDTWDNAMVNVSKPQDLAHGAGFSGQRAVYTWAGRVNLLHSLGFIDVKPGRSGAISHVLIYNPHWVIWDHHNKKTSGLLEADYNALLDRALEVGANDMLEGPPVSPPEPVES